MSTLEDLKVLRDALDCIAHGALPRWGRPLTKTGEEATKAAITMYERFVRALLTEGAAKAAMDAAKLAEDQYRTHAENLTYRCELAERERDELKETLSELRKSMRDLRVLRSSCTDSIDGDFRVHLSEKEFDALFLRVMKGRE